MSHLNLQLITQAGMIPLAFEMRRMINAGYVGRNQDAVRHHIAELAKIGVAPPDSVPTWFPMIRSGLTFAHHIETVDENSSGEVEFVLLMDGKNIYVGVGSDHTDRTLEAADMLKSKQACPNVMSPQVWSYAEVRGHWDQLELRSWVRSGDGPWTLYQEGTLGLILTAEQLLVQASEVMKDDCRHGLVVFSGTLPVLTGTISCGGEFRCELNDPVLGRSIGCSYAIRKLDYMKPVAALVARA